MHVLLGVTCCNSLILLALFSSFCVQLPTDCLAVLNHSCALLALSFGSCHLWLGILQWSPQVLLVLLSSWAWCLLSSVLLHVYVTCTYSAAAVGAPTRTRTGTAQGRQILSLLCLPIPPWAQLLACPEGLEPPTHSLEGCCSNPAELRREM